MGHFVNGWIKVQAFFILVSKCIIERTMTSKPTGKNKLHRGLEKINREVDRQIRQQSLEIRIPDHSQTVCQNDVLNLCLRNMLVFRIPTLEGLYEALPFYRKNISHSIKLLQDCGILSADGGILAWNKDTGAIREKLLKLQADRRYIRLLEAEYGLV